MYTTTIKSRRGQGWAEAGWLSCVQQQLALLGLVLTLSALAGKRMCSCWRSSRQGSSGMDEIQAVDWPCILRGLRTGAADAQPAALGQKDVAHTASSGYSSGPLWRWALVKRRAGVTQALQRAVDEYAQMHAASLAALQQGSWKAGEGGCQGFIVLHLLPHVGWGNRCDTQWPSPALSCTWAKGLGPARALQI